MTPIILYCSTLRPINDTFKRSLQMLLLSGTLFSKLFSTESKNYKLSILLLSTDENLKDL